MEQRFLYEKLNVVKELGQLKDIPEIIEKGLAPHIHLREYQEEAFRYFITYFEEENLRKNKQIHNLFHMATGSGKTVIMAGLILYLYTKGYRNFMFFVNQTNILEKTKENFTNPLSSKYLFNDVIEYLGNKINIKMVDNFSGNDLEEDIQICFTTTQKLHMDLFTPKENSLTYEDFENNKIVFISDESHHVNTLTKRASKAEKEAKNSWEYSVTNAFYRNRDNIMLEFTATADLKDTNVKNKYLDKIIYNYPLINFRSSGYTKDFQNFGTDSEPWERTLIALIMSEYRKYLFADCKLNIKPVIMLKSQKIKESEDFYEEFFSKIDSLTGSEIQELYSANIDILTQALDYFKTKDSSFQLLEHSLKSSFTKDNSIIINGAADNSRENQLLVNSLEDEDNPIRLIFAVDMLNEGWDVLNLFDIVRLYDTRQASGKAGKIGAYTIKEAQLIGRGARYCPFKVSEEQDRFKRKYDNDLNNEYRILETMFFHSRNDSRYIAELRQALIATGLQDENPIKLEYKLKKEFKDTELYKKGLVFSNKRIPKGRDEVKSLEERIRNKVYRYTQKTTRGAVVNLIGDNKTSTTASEIKTIKFKDIDYNVLLGASEKFNELRFSVIQSKFPHVKTLKEFLTSEEYLGNSTIEIKYFTENITGRDLFKACIGAFEKVSSYIISLKPEYIGTTEFEPKAIKSVIKDKSIYLSRLDENGGKGVSQVNCPNPEYQIDLSKESWYVFNDNYGTSEEKLFIKFFKTDIEPKLKAKGLEYYVVRNERIPELAIYSFEHGERFEPDYLLFVAKKNSDNFTNYQTYIEPKGNHLLKEEKWKEEFLNEIGEKHYISKTLISGNEYKVLGLPFYNEQYRREDFLEKVSAWIDTI